jgi:hypothetical protein
MYLQQTLYPIGLASTNIAIGWLLYYLSEPILGGLLVVVGVFVILTSIGSTLSRYKSMFSNQY